MDENVRGRVLVASPLRPMVPPTPPSNIRGQIAVVHLVIDSLGQVKADSTAVCGLSSLSYARSLARSLAAIPFRPAESDGRPIRSVFPVTFGF
jgi:hypothetical protein